MTDSTPAATTQLSRSSRSRYGDTQAMDDIQALLTSPGRPSGEAAIDDVAEIVKLTGRSMATPRLLALKQGTEKNGLPYAVINAEGTVIRASQDPDTGAIRVTILTMNSHDEQHLRVEVDGLQVVQVPPATEDNDAGDDQDSATHRAEGGAS